MRFAEVVGPGGGRVGRKLYRSREDYWIAGVCGGLGRYFGVDSNPIRLGFVLLAAWNGLGVLLYLVTVLIVPEPPLPERTDVPGASSPPSEQQPPRSSSALPSISAFSSRTDLSPSTRLQSQIPLVHF